MKSKTFLLISTFLISFVLSCDNKGSVILRVLQNIKNSLPDLIKQVKNMKECQTSKLKSICKGYNYWNSQSNAKIWKGIGKDKENIENFFAILMDNLPIEKTDAQKILPYFKKMAKFADFTEVLGPDLINDKNVRESAKKGCYFSIFMESNCENKSEFDLLFTSVKTNVQLGKDIFLLKEVSGNFFSGSYDDKAVEQNANLIREQYGALLNLLQFSSYLNALEMIKLF